MHSVSHIIVPDITVVSVCLQGMPALHHAVSHQKNDLVQLLILLGADVNATFKVGQIS